MMRARAKQQMPMVLLTLLSIIQALALELLWVHVTEEPLLTSLSLPALLSWLQIAVTLICIMLIWLLYSGMTMRFSWVPTPGDSLVPFGIGILEFTLIASLGLDFLMVWFLILAIIFAVMTATFQSILRRARQDRENNTFFSTVTPATWRDFYPAMIVVTLLAGLGVILGVTGDQGVFALLSLLIAAGVHLHQIYLNQVRWRRAMDLNPDV